MKSLLRATTAALLLAGGVCVAGAQTTVTTTTRTVETRGPVELSPAQRTTIYRTVRRERRAAPPPDVRFSVGTAVPRSVELYELPEEAYVEMPAVKRYRYMVVNNEVLLVDPATSEVVEVIRE